MAELAAHDAANGEVASDEEYSDESERDDDDEQEEVAEGAAGSQAVVGNAVAGLPDVGELRIAEPAGEEEDSEERDDSEEDEDDNEEDGSEEEQSGEEEEEGDRRAKKERAPRIGRRPVRSGQRDVEAIVTASLTRSKAQQDRRHHGKKPVSANVLGRQKGSKKKQNANAREARAASKQGGGRGGDFW